VEQVAGPVSRGKERGSSLIFVDNMEGFGPADLEAISSAAKRFGFPWAEASAPWAPHLDRL
jgi:hypothetical protein